MFQAIHACLTNLFLEFTPRSSQGITKRVDGLLTISFKAFPSIADTHQCVYCMEVHSKYSGPFLWPVQKFKTFQVHSKWRNMERHLCVWLHSKYSYGSKSILKILLIQKGDPQRQDSTNHATRIGWNIWNAL